MTFVKKSATFKVEMYYSAGHGKQELVFWIILENIKISLNFVSLESGNPGLNE